MNDYNDSSDLLKVETIFNILKKEMQIPHSPQPIPFDLYQNIASFVSKIKNNSDRNEQSVIDVKLDKTIEVLDEVKNNLLDIIINLTLLLFVCRCKKMFDSYKDKEFFDYSVLTNEEKYVFYGNREREYRINTILNMIFEGKSKTLENISSSINNNFVMIRFLDAMDQFVGVNMNKYGPFRKNDIAILPFENARSMIDNNKAVELNKII